MSSCELCDGSLQVWEGGGEVHDTPGYAQPAPVAFPCPPCLSVRADDKIRAVAREWLGSDIWRTMDVGGYGSPQHPKWWRGGVRILPLYLGAGLNLGCQVLAVRWGVHPSKLHTALADLDCERGWPWLRVQCAKHGGAAPESWALPAKGVPHRAARALALLLAG